MIGTNEAAKRLGVTPRRILQFIEQGRLPDAEQVSGRWIISDDDITNFERRKQGRRKK